jgi:penicillin-binding protein 1A
MPDGTRWIPQNFELDQSGPMMFRDALKRSKNLVTARILQEIVKPSEVVTYAHKMGITTNLRAVDALALGTSEVIPLELTSAYGIFPNKGIHVKPIAITKVVNRWGEVVYEEFPESNEALKEQTAYIMTNMLQTVANEGTGVTARTIYDFKRPAGGKTGTADDYKDAWFIGFTPQISAGVWVGIDDHRLDLGRAGTGALAALPIWAKFMKTTHDTLNLPILDFEMPEKVVKLKICTESKKIAGIYCPEVIEEVFHEDTAPKEECEIHTGRIDRKNRRKKPIIF